MFISNYGSPSYKRIRILGYHTQDIDIIENDEMRYMTPGPDLGVLPPLGTIISAPPPNK